MAATQTDQELRASLAARLAEARARTDELFQLVRPEALYDRPIAERHRIIFYLGHFEAFDWNLIARGSFDLEAFNEPWDRLFAFGIDPTDGELPIDKPSEWPAVSEVHGYNRRLREVVDRCLAEASFNGSAQPYLEGGLIFHVAIEHRLMHAETLAYMLHGLPFERKIPQPMAPTLSAPPRTPRKIEILAGTATLGLVCTLDNPFGWDNEFEPHTVNVPAFAIDADNVANGEFLAFVRAGGYDERSLWRPADWEWKSQAGIAHPQFWRRQGDAWRYGTMFAEIPLPLDWPVYVSHAEASAYARWRGLSLPTEAQFHRAAYGTSDGTERLYPWGNDPPQAHHGNFDFQRWTPAPVGAHPAGASAFGVRDLVGNGWEWTSTVFAPFRGFTPFSFYPGYSANFFDGKHYVMKGGSPRTSAYLLRRSFRNWFQPHYPYIYAAFRCVEN